MDEPLPSGRACGGCTLCCKVMGIGALAKPAGQWCRHCAVGSGCTIYPDRPAECRTFSCGYLSWPMAGAHWYPATSHMVILMAATGKRLTIQVDPDFPEAWRAAPFRAEIAQWTAFAARHGNQVVVAVGARVFLALPDREIELVAGQVREGRS
ncbi:MAG: hypothetical protein WDN44_11295 [Sphingomonas sp.]